MLENSPTPEENPQNEQNRQILVPEHFSLKDVWIPTDSYSGRSPLLQEEFMEMEFAASPALLDTLFDAIRVPLNDPDFQLLQRRSLELELQIETAVNVEAGLPADKRVFSDISTMNDFFDPVLSRAASFYDEGVAVVAGMFVRDVFMDNGLPEGSKLGTLLKEWDAVQAEAAAMILAETREGLPEQLQPLTRNLVTFLYLGGPSLDDESAFPEFTELTRGLYAEKQESLRQLTTEYIFPADSEPGLRDWLTDFNRNAQSRSLDIDVLLDHTSAQEERDSLHAERRRLIPNVVEEGWYEPQDRPIDLTVLKGRVTSALVSPVQVYELDRYARSPEIYVEISQEGDAEMARTGAALPLAGIRLSGKLSTVDDNLLAEDIEVDGLFNLSPEAINLEEVLSLGVPTYEWKHEQSVLPELAIHQALYDAALVLGTEIHMQQEDIAYLLANTRGREELETSRSRIEELLVRLHVPEGIDVESVSNATLEVQIQTTGKLEPTRFTLLLERDPGNQFAQWDCTVSYPGA